MSAVQKSDETGKQQRCPQPSGGELAGFAFSGSSSVQKRTNLWGITALWRRWLIVILTLGTTLAACSFFIPQVLCLRQEVLDYVAMAILGLVVFGGSFNFWLNVIGFLLYLEKSERSRAKEERGAQPGAEPVVTDTPSRLHCAPADACPRDSASAAAERETVNSTSINGDERRNSHAVDEIANRTAIVMPIYNEDVIRVFLGVRQTWLSIKQAGLVPHCDFYLLSDSTDETIKRGEENVYLRLLEEFQSRANLRHGSNIQQDGPNGPISECCQECLDDEGDMADEDRPPDRLGANGDSQDAYNSLGQIFLIRRKERTKYKAGNIANFLTTHGAAYDFMLVLDADSVMLGGTIKRLILRMQAQADLAILQTAMTPIRSVTPFARACQFGASRTLPLFALGQYWFYGRDSVYWGHNALIRIAPFMRFCNLPTLPGKPPLGGEIMSQDIVEAALLSRGGWAIEWDVDPHGSFDETPANILTYGRRDRRWCQGNFQHFWLIFGGQIRAAHRFYFGYGIFTYATAMLMLILMSLGFLQGLRGREYLWDSMSIASFLVFFLMLFLGPKFFGYVRRLREGTKPGRELLSTLTEVTHSVLVSPSIMYLHICFVLGVIAGRTTAWKSQTRNPEESLDWRTAVRLLWIPTVLGIGWLTLAIQKTPGFLPYLILLLAGWILSIPIAVWSSRPALGAWLERHGLLEQGLSTEENEALGPLTDTADCKSCCEREPTPVAEAKGGGV